MNLESFLPAFQALLAALLVGLAAFASALAGASAWRAFRRSPPLDGLPGHVWQAILFAVVVDLLAAAALGVGRALELLTDGWAAIVGLVTALFGGWLGYRAATKIASKGSIADVTPPGGGVP